MTVLDQLLERLAAFELTTMPVLRKALKVAGAAKAATRKTRAAPLQTPMHKRGRTLVPGRAAPHARVEKTKPAAILPPTGALPTRTPTQAVRQSRVNLQSAGQRGKRFTTPATSAVEGASGKEPSARRRPTPKG